VVRYDSKLSLFLRDIWKLLVTEKFSPVATDAYIGWGAKLFDIEVAFLEGLS